MKHSFVPSNIAGNVSDFSFRNASVMASDACNIQTYVQEVATASWIQSHNNQEDARLLHSDNVSLGEQFPKIRRIVVPTATHSRKD